MTPSPTESIPTPLPATAGTPGADVDHHFRTDHLTGELRGRSVRGGVVTVAAQGCRLFLQTLQTVILARLLLPGDFGLVAMAASLVGVLDNLRNVGLTLATVQRRQITHRQVSTLFWVNVAASGAVLALVAGAAPAIAWYFHERRCCSSRSSSGPSTSSAGWGRNTSRSSSGRCGSRPWRRSRSPAPTFGIGLSLALAWYHFGYWALAFTGPANAAARVALLWWYCPWRPSAPEPGGGRAVAPPLRGRIMGDGRARVRGGERGQRVRRPVLGPAGARYYVRRVRAAPAAAREHQRAADAPWPSPS